MGAAGSVRGVRGFVEIADFFSGCALNAVDAKGRVSLPADFRSVIEGRAEAIVREGRRAPDKVIELGEHERHPCLTAYDAGYAAVLHAKLQKRIAAREDGADELSALEDAEVDAMGGTEKVAFDAGGRMVLNPMIRSLAGITDLAFFVGAGETFQVWEPHRFHATQGDKPRVIRKLEFLMAERGVKL